MKRLFKKYIWNGIFHPWARGDQWDFSIGEKHFNFQVEIILLLSEPKAGFVIGWLKTENPSSQLKCQINIPGMKHGFLSQNRLYFILKPKKASQISFHIYDNYIIWLALLFFNWPKIVFTTTRKVCCDLKINFYSQNVGIVEPNFFKHKCKAKQEIYLKFFPYCVEKSPWILMERPLAIVCIAMI